MSEEDEMFCIHDIMNFLRYIYANYQNYPDVIFYKALVLVHKFFRKVSIRHPGNDKNIVATACFFLSSKIEDCPFKLIDLAIFYHRAELMRNKWPMKMPSDKQKTHIQGKICEMEGELLRQIGFDLEIDLPYRYLKQFKNYPAPNMDKLLKTATSICNDTFLKPLCIYYHPMQIACGCIYYASLSFKVSLPDNNDKPWFRYLHDGIRLKDLQDIVNIMKDVYKKIEERKKQNAARTTSQPTETAKPAPTVVTKDAAQ